MLLAAVLILTQPGAQSVELYAATALSVELCCSYFQSNEAAETQLLSADAALKPELLVTLLHPLRVPQRDV